MRRYTTLAMESRGDIRCITLDRPERRNAFDSRMISELTQAFDESAQEPSLRGILLSSAGPVFCAGADIQWMQSTSPVSDAQATDDAHRLTRMYRAIDGHLSNAIVNITTTQPFKGTMATRMRMRNNAGNPSMILTHPITS